VLVREGRLRELIAIEHQTELVLENASEELLKEIEALAARNNAKVIARRKSTTTLERLFLDATEETNGGRSSATPPDS
jgi:ABC-2 type transport system ATP-binding protein